MATSGSPDTLPPGIDVLDRSGDGADRILAPEALAFIGRLQHRFGATRLQLLERRHRRQAELDDGAPLTLPPETEAIRTDRSWRVAEPPPDLLDRRVEITGPAEPKMMINALNSGARVFMADFQDALSPTWSNVVGGQAACYESVRGTLALESP